MLLWLLLFISSSIVIYYHRKHSYWNKFGLKGPFPIPFLGTSYLYLWKPIHVVESDLAKKYGPFVGLYEGSQPVLLVSDPEMIKLIAMKEFQSFPQSFTFASYKHPIEKLFPELLWGPKWKHSRGHITQCFTVSKLRKTFPMIDKCSDICVRSLADEFENNNKSEITIEMKNFWLKYYCDTIFQFCLTLDAHVYQSRDNVIVEKMIDLSRPFVSNFMLNMFMPSWFMKLFRLSVIDANALDYLVKVVSHLVTLRSQSQQTVSSSDVLDRLINVTGVELPSKGEEREFTNDELIASIIDLLFNGFETSSSLLAWCCWRLALNPDCQDHLAKEIDSLDKFDYDNVISAAYLDAVINESLRIDPPETHNERVSHANYHHPGTNIVIPKGAKISMPIYAMHHDPDNFSEPEKFKPERFLPGARESIKPFTFIPFGTGYRACLGAKYALLVSKLALAKLIKSYRLVVTKSTTIDVDYDWGSILLCAKEINVGLEPKNLNI